MDIYFKKKGIGMQEQTTRTKRTYITGRQPRRRREIDMEAVYKDFDNGMKWDAVCDKYKVSRTTLLRRHEEYQKLIEEEEKKNGAGAGKVENANYEFPPLPQ